MPKGKKSLGTVVGSAGRRRLIAVMQACMQTFPSLFQLPSCHQTTATLEQKVTSALVALGKHSAKGKAAQRRRKGHGSVEESKQR